MVRRSSRGSYRSRRLRGTRRLRRANKNTRRVRKQRGGEIPSGYSNTVVSYTPHSDEIGDVDAVPRIGSKEEFEADSAAAQP